MPLGAFGLFAFSGMADHDAAGVDLCERYKAQYGDDWWFLTYLGWSHTENGNVATGRRITQRALESRRENGHALHALAHAMFEDGSTADAERLIEGWLPIYRPRGITIWPCRLASGLAGAGERRHRASQRAIYASTSSQNSIRPRRSTS